MILPDFSFETAALSRGARRVAGVDEVGRGPLAGPVTACAVVLDPGNIPQGLNDSKKLGAKRREALAAWLAAHCDHAIAHVAVEDIDRLNIHHATQMAMARAVAGLRRAPGHVLVDGRHVPPDLACPAQAIVRGDARCATIAAASILAKVARDRLMADLARDHPGYGWETNAGYPTPAHRQALRDKGVTPHHRRSFRPVHNILCGADRPTP